MKLKDVAAISGKPGLFKIIKPSRSGIILESLDEKKAKTVASLNHKVSILSEISVYTNTQEGVIALADIFVKIKEKHGNEAVKVETSNNNALLKFLESVLPEYDKNRVYASDVKKMLNWYNIILVQAPQVFETEPIKEE
jgi:hypothetical protein